METTTTERRGVLLLAADDIEETARRHNEPGWLIQRRHEAWQAWERLPLPDRETQKEWRRTNYDAMRLADLTLPDPLGDAAARPARLAPPQGELSATLSLVDGRVSSASVRDDLAERGVRVLSFRDALREIPGVVERGFMTVAASPAQSKFAALHAAFHESGAIVFVPRGVEIDEPIWVGQELTEGGVLALPHLLVYADEMSRCTVIGESYSEETGHAVAVPIVEVLARGGSNVVYADLQRWGSDMYVLPELRGVAFRDATLTLATLGFGGGILKGCAGIDLVEAGSSAHILGLQFIDHEQHYELDTVQRHVAGQTTSRLDFKTALSGASTAISNGMVRIEPGAQKSDAFQENRNLLLSSKAHADPIPALEILANDVRCSHGTTVGPIDPDQEFYLRARGLPKHIAERLIVHGFFQNVIDKLPPVLQPRLDDEIERKIERTVGGEA